jgi:hypothetical protein
VKDLEFKLEQREIEVKKQKQKNQQEQLELCLRNKQVKKAKKSIAAVSIANTDRRLSSKASQSTKSTKSGNFVMRNQTRIALQDCKSLDKLREEQSQPAQAGSLSTDNLIFKQARGGLEELSQTTKRTSRSGKSNKAIRDRSEGKENKDPIMSATNKQASGNNEQYEECQAKEKRDTTVFTPAEKRAPNSTSRRRSNVSKELTKPQKKATTSTKAKKSTTVSVVKSSQSIKAKSRARQMADWFSDDSFSFA